jgi:hypothetical protein
MKTTHKRKKNLIVSYKNLTDDLKELFKEAYPEGYNNYITKFVKPNGEAIFVVPFETADTAYMVKFDVKIDTLGEDLDKALFDDDGDDEGGKDDEFAPISEALEKEEENPSHRERHLRHGDFEDILDENKKKKATLGVDKEGLKEAFADDGEADELDSYEKLDGEDDEDDDEMEPTDEDLRGIEDEFLDAENPPLDATIPEEEMVAISKKPAKKPAAKAKPATKAKLTPKAKAPQPKVAPKTKTPQPKSAPIAKAVKPSKVTKPAKAVAKPVKTTKTAKKK